MNGFPPPEKENVFVSKSWSKIEKLENKVAANYFISPRQFTLKTECSRTEECIKLTLGRFLDRK